MTKEDAQIVTYGTPTFYVEEGWYTIAGLERLLEDCKCRKKQQDALLKKISTNAGNGLREKKDERP